MCVKPTDEICNESSPGSSAGAGSGEFHVYRHLRRREYQRQDFLDKTTEKVGIFFIFYYGLPKDTRLHLFSWEPISFKRWGVTNKILIIKCSCSKRWIWTILTRCQITNRQLMKEQPNAGRKGWCSNHGPAKFFLNV